MSTLPALAIALGGCCFGQSIAAPSAPADDPREVAFGHLINELAAHAVGRLHGAPVDPGLDCADTRAPMAVTEYETIIRELGPSATTQVVLARVSGVPAGAPGVSIVSFVSAGDVVRWMEVTTTGQPVTSMASSAVAARYPAITDFVARTLEGMSDCRLPMVAAPDIALAPHADAARWQTPAVLLDPSVCAGARGLAPASLQISPLHLVIMLSGNGRRAQVTTMLGEFPDPATMVRTFCLVAPTVDSE
jgi:hypothetical protein